VDTLKQLTLEPFLPGGFMEAWLSWWHKVSPDLTANNQEALKIIGTLALHTLCKTRLLHIGLQPMTMFLGLFGEPSSGKSWVPKMFEMAFRELVIAAGTPEAIAESIERQRVGIIIWDEVAELISQAKRRGYMSEFPNLTNQLYNTQSVYMTRRRAKTVKLPADTYFVSLILTGLDEDYAGISELFGRGFERRLTPVRLKGRLPRFPRALDDSNLPGVEHLVKLRRWYEALKDVQVFIKMRGLEKLEERRELEPPEEIKGTDAETNWFDTIKRLLSAILIDKALPRSLPKLSTLGASERLNAPSREGGGERGTSPSTLPEGIEVNFSDVQTFRQFQTVHGVTKVIVMNVSENCLTQHVHALRPLLAHLSEYYTKFQPRGELELSSYFIRIMKFLDKCGGVTTERNLSRWLRIYARKFEEVMKSAEQQGIVVRRVIGHSKYILKASMKVCGTCRHFMAPTCKMKTDPNAMIVWEELLMEEGGECWEPWS
jgi:hypothetical protein